MTRRFSSMTEDMAAVEGFLRIMNQRLDALEAQLLGGEQPAPPSTEEDGAQPPSPPQHINIADAEKGRRKPGAIAVLRKRREGRKGVRF